MSSLKTCQICTNDYDEYDHQPYVITPCGHTICEECYDNLEYDICPLDRRKIESSTLNRLVLDSILSPETTSLDLLKRSLIDEIKGLGRNVFVKNDDTLKTLTDRITAQIEKEKKDKIKAIEDDADKLLDELDSVYDRLMDESVEVNENTDNIKTHGEITINRAKSSKTAIDAAQEIKKQFADAMKHLKKVNIKFKANKCSNENWIGCIVDENDANKKNDEIVKIKKVTKNETSSKRLGTSRAKTSK